MFEIGLPTRLRVPVVAILAFLIAFAGRATAAEPMTADALALRILDCEALYTVTDGLKPVSEGFWQIRFPAAQETTEEVEQTRRVLNDLPLGPDRETGVYIFVKAFDGKRTASAFVAHKPSLRALIERRKEVFEPIGVTAASTAQQVLEKIDRAPGSARWRAFGLVFGYPEYAVEFFVAAGEHEAETKRFVTRDFVNLPTFTSDQGRFVYAVPKGHVERDEDRELKSKTAEIIGRYQAWRSVYVDQHKLGAVELLRNWIHPPAVPVLPESCSVVAEGEFDNCIPRLRIFGRHRRR